MFLPSFIFWFSFGHFSKRILIEIGSLVDFLLWVKLRVICMHLRSIDFLHAVVHYRLKLQVKGGKPILNSAKHFSTIGHFWHGILLGIKFVFLHIRVSSSVFCLKNLDLAKIVVFTFDLFRRSIFWNEGIPFLQNLARIGVSSASF